MPHSMRAGPGILHVTTCTETLTTGPQVQLAVRTRTCSIFVLRNEVWEIHTMLCGFAFTEL
jgi:hypothetical protein